MSGGGILSGYCGGIDRIEPVLSGWVAEIARPEAPVTLLAVIDHRHRITAVADRGEHRGDRPRRAPLRFRIALPPHLLDGAEHDLAVLLADGRRPELRGLRRASRSGRSGPN